MNMSKSAESQNAVNANYGLLECYVCFEGFEKEGLNTPRIIPTCGHTICHSCILEIKGTRCPICSVVCPHFNDRQIDKFPKNFQLLDQIDLLRAKNDESKSVNPPICENSCNRKNCVQVYCIQCDMSYCQECYDAHMSFKIFKSHTSKPWTPIIHDAASSLRCNIHPEFPLNIVCLQPNCMGKDSLICLMCVQYGPDHTGHKSDTVGNVVDSYRKLLVKDAESLESLINESLAAVTKMEGIISSIRATPNTTVNATVSSEDKVIASIKAEHNRIVALLNEKTQDLIQQVKDNTTQRVTALSDQQKQLQAFLSKNYSTLHKIQQLLHTDSDIDLMRQYKQCSNEVIEIGHMERQVEPIYTAEISIDYNLSSIEKLMSSFQFKPAKLSNLPLQNIFALGSPPSSTGGSRPFGGFVSLPTTTAGMASTSTTTTAGFGGFGSSTPSTTASGFSSSTPSTTAGFKSSTPSTTAGFSGFGSSTPSTTAGGLGFGSFTPSTTAGFSGFGSSTPSTTASGFSSSTPSTTAGFGSSTPSTTAGFGRFSSSTPSTTASGFGFSSSTPSTTAGFSSSTPSTTAGFSSSTPSTTAGFSSSTPSTTAGLGPSTSSTTAGFSSSTPSTTAGGFGFGSSTPTTTAGLGPSTSSTTAGGFGFCSSTRGS